jgi:hypothetical protein
VHPIMLVIASVFLTVSTAEALAVLALVPLGIRFSRCLRALCYLIFRVAINKSDEPVLLYSNH